MSNTHNESGEDGSASMPLPLRIDDHCLCLSRTWLLSREWKCIGSWKSAGKKPWHEWPVTPFRGQKVRGQGQGQGHQAA